jgi:ankyrin repeat protein
MIRIACPAANRFTCSVSPQGVELVHLGRRLLEDAYPREIAKYHVDWRNSLKNTPLHMAAYNGRPGVASVLVGYGAYLNATNAAGMTPLDYASFGKEKRRKGDIDAVITLLIEKGARSNIQPDQQTSIAGRCQSAEHPHPVG